MLVAQGIVSTVLSTRKSRLDLSSVGEEFAKGNRNSSKMT
jgi:hypothetical protein